MRIPKEIIYWDKLYWEKRSKFKEEIKKLNKLFNLKSDEGFVVFPPTFFSGHIDSDKIKYIMIGLNPSYSGKHNKKEIEYRKRERKKGELCDLKNIFSYFNEYGRPSYYWAFREILGGLEKKPINREEYFNFLNKCAINIDTFPFHSRNYKIDIANLSIPQIKKLMEFWGIAKSLILSSGADKIIMFGKPSYHLLLLDDEIGHDKLNKLYSFKKQGKNRMINIYEINFKKKKIYLIDNFIGGKSRLKGGDITKIINFFKNPNKHLKNV